MIKLWKLYFDLNYLFGKRPGRVRALVAAVVGVGVGVVFETGEYHHLLVLGLGAGLDGEAALDLDVLEHGAFPDAGPPAQHAPAQHALLAHLGLVHEHAPRQFGPRPDAARRADDALLDRGVRGDGDVGRQERGRLVHGRVGRDERRCADLLRVGVRRGGRRVGGEMERGVEEEGRGVDTEEERGGRRSRRRRVDVSEDRGDRGALSIGSSGWGNRGGAAHVREVDVVFDHSAMVAVAIHAVFFVRSGGGGDVTKYLTETEFLRKAVLPAGFGPPANHILANADKSFVAGG